MFYKISLILKYFLYTNEASFRRSYLFQMGSIYLGSLIISLTLSIMDGMQSEIFNKVTTFNYKYKGNNNISKYDNFGSSEVGRLKFKKIEIMTEVHTYSNLLSYRNKIKDHIVETIEDISNPSNMVIIGETLSKEYNIFIGDTLKIEDIININIVSGQFKSRLFIVSDIYDFKFLNYDMDNIFIQNTPEIFSGSNIEYYYDSELSKEFISNIFEIGINKYSDLFAAINFEKKLYMLIGIIGLLISSIFIFNNTILVLLEKIKQFHLLSSLGFNRRLFTSLCILSNFMISVLFCALGLLSTIFIYIIGKTYNIFDSFFIYTPFEDLPILLSFNNFIATFLIVAIISVLSTYLSIINMKNQIITR